MKKEVQSITELMVDISIASFSYLQRLRETVKRPFKIENLHTTITGYGFIGIGVGLTILGHYTFYAPVEAVGAIYAGFGILNIKLPRRS